MTDGHRWLEFWAVTRSRDKRQFSGRVQLLEPTGFSVVSDIDDTIKVSQVLDKGELLANTFIRPYREVTGMATQYRQWAKHGAAFHYVSSSPWQLFQPLMNFMETSGFPAGDFHLK